jgi:hypothetical protein
MAGPWDRYQTQPTADGPWKKFQGGGSGEPAAPSRASQVAKGVMEAQQRAAGDVAEYQAMPGWQKPFQAVGDVMTVMGDTLTQGYGDKGKAWLKSKLPGGDDYDTELSESRRSTEGARNRFGNPGTVAALELATNYKALPSMVSKAPNFTTRALTSTAEGAALGAAQAGGHDQDMRTGAEAGALWGGLGSLGGEAVDTASKVFQGGKDALSNPSFRQDLWNYGKDAALTSGVGYALDQLGVGNPYLISAMGTLGRRYLPQQSSLPNVPPPTTPPAGAPGLRDVLTRLLTRGGIYATGP